MSNASAVVATKTKKFQIAIALCRGLAAALDANGAFGPEPLRTGFPVGRRATE
jgi:hypothetical protein